MNIMEKIILGLFILLLGYIIYNNMVANPPYELFSGDSQASGGDSQASGGDSQASGPENPEPGADNTMQKQIPGPSTRLYYLDSEINCDCDNTENYADEKLEINDPSKYYAKIKENAIKAIQPDLLYSGYDYYFSNKYNGISEIGLIPLDATTNFPKGMDDI